MRIGGLFKRAWLLPALLLSLVGMGCSANVVQRAPVPSPTKNLVVVIITATPQPVLELTNLVEPSITPLATVTPLDMSSPTPAETATFTPTPRKAVGATATRKPTARPAIAAVVPTVPGPPTAVPYQYPAPRTIGPAAGTVIHNGDSIVLEFASVGPLAPTACYRVDIQFANPNAATAAPVPYNWVDLCGDQHSSGARLAFTITQFRTDPHNYSGLVGPAAVQAPTNYLNVRWSAAVSRQDGMLLGSVGAGNNFVFQMN